MVRFRLPVLIKTLVISGHERRLTCSHI